MASNAPSQLRSLSDRDRTLAEIQERVLWLSVNMVYHANRVRPNPDGLKVGGHQASSSSVVTILTSLYFDFMKSGDKISIKPHASPVFHAIQYLLGNLDQKYLTTLREFQGLQAYPSRTKDPDPVDFSTGSVGIGAVAPNFAALAGEYIRGNLRPNTSPRPRYVSLVGDAELDEGSVWEAIAEPLLGGVGKVIWVVDLNRQSLDRVIPGIRVEVWRQMFAANGWHVIDAKFGKQLQAAYALPGGKVLRQAIDEMPNEVYQRLLRRPPESMREWLPRLSPRSGELTKFISQWNDLELHELISNLGGHDFSTLRNAFSKADATDAPSVVFAYTLKGWMLPSIGDPQNHSVILSSEQMEQLRVTLGIDEDSIWGRFTPTSSAGRLCSEKRKALRSGYSRAKPPEKLSIPTTLGRGYRGRLSTQQTLGYILTEMVRIIPEVADRVVTVSPDVATSTNLGGWINKVGVWARRETGPLPEDIVRALNWKESPKGQHLELGISENNLFMVLGQLGLSYEMLGELLFPIGTVYDPFVRRGLDALFYSLYIGGKFLFVGTPSGISLGPEGGAHQSVITPSIGAELPDVAFYEPCFGQELEWIILSALKRIQDRTESVYLRLTTKRIDQNILRIPEDPDELELLRTQVLQGAYRLVDRRGDPDYQAGNIIHILASGAMVPEAVEASSRLLDKGILANVFNITGPGPLYKQFQKSVIGTANDRPRLEFLAEVISTDERQIPIVSVTDGHPHSLAWIGGALGTAIYPLGVTGFGQSGSPSDLYKEYGIDVSTIIDTCFGALGI